VAHSSPGIGAPKRSATLFSGQGVATAHAALTGGYTRRRRKEIFEQMRELAMTIMLEQPVRTQGCTDAVWHRAVETWLQQHEIITMSEPKSVTQSP
jgi:hypothetical protein